MLFNTAQTVATMEPTHTANSSSLRLDYILEEKHNTYDNSDIII